jgi:outer membrane protein OmpA-like peptidoglycan-associated protein
MIKLLNTKGTIMRRAFLPLLTAGVAWAGFAVAQPAPQYSAKDVADALESLPCEAPLVAGADGLCHKQVDNNRGFRLPTAGAPAPARSAAATPTAPVAAARPAATQMASNSATPKAAPSRSIAGNLLISFHLGSAELNEQDKANLKAFALGLQDPRLSNRRFEIAGHTDASGTQEHNRTLSQARAESVKAYLESQGIDGERLTAKGYGSDQLSDPANPTGAVNRRVEVKRGA